MLTFFQISKCYKVLIKFKMLHFCQAQRSVAESIPVVEVAATLDQDLFRLVVAKKKKKVWGVTPFSVRKNSVENLPKNIFFIVFGVKNFRPWMCWRKISLMLPTSNVETSHHLQFLVCSNNFSNSTLKVDPRSPGCQEECCAAIPAVQWEREWRVVFKSDRIVQPYLSSCSILAPAFKSAATVALWLFFTAHSSAVYPHLVRLAMILSSDSWVSHVLVLEVRPGSH